MPFTQRTLDFLYFNKKNDSRLWYAEHKDDFKKYVFEPFAELVEKMTPEMLKIDSAFITEPKTDRTISRIYRDCRFSPDKSLYRDTMWITFMREKKLYNGLPGYFFEISPYGYRYGCGYYQADTASMASMRELIISNSRYFTAAFECVKIQNVFKFEGESFKRNRFLDYPKELQQWLNLKSFCLIANSSDYETLLSENLYETLTDAFTLLAPVYEFLMHAETNKEVIKK